MTTHLKAFIAKTQSLGYRHDTHRVFSDFVEMGAIALCSIDPCGRDQREARYMQLVGAYSKDEANLIAELLAHVAMGLKNPCDFLGDAFMQLDLASKWKGQFFTPYSLCSLMGGLTLPNSATLKAKVATQGYITISDPACGAGATLIAGVHTAAEAGLDVATQLHITAQDVDIKAVHMCYIQLSLMGVPATVIHGNTLTGEQYSVWHTPAHILGGWTRRFGLNRQAALEIKEPLMA